MRRFSYAVKFAATVAFALAADWLFLFEWLGATLGYYALALTVTVALLRPASGKIGLAASAAFALVMIDSPSLLALALYWMALAFAVLRPRSVAFDNAWRWAQRLLLHGFTALVLPVLDFARWRRAKRRRPARVAGLGTTLILPVVGTILFLTLFAIANPLIDEALGQVDTGFLAGLFSAPRIIVWLVAFAGVWAMLRPFALLRFGPVQSGGAPTPLPGVTVASVTLSLAAFNLLFALQNGLDIAFLWSGAPLPEGMTLAGYAHRGAYPLIATALLAGLFVLVTLRPGSETAASRPIRMLVTFWVGQNIFLVASSILRTLDYIDAYSLTRLRIAALIWMGLVALGLVLICWRLWRGKSAGWLINANAAAALLVLAGCSVVDLGRMAAAWNVRHAREAGGRGAALDLCYLNGLGSSALLPILELEGRTSNADLKQRLAWSRNAIMDRMEPVLADWHGWTWRDDRRMREAERLIAEEKLERRRVEPRRCDASPYPPPSAPPVVTEPVR